jgi:hypothetical protein
MYIMKDIQNQLKREAKMARDGNCFAWAKMFEQCAYLLRKNDREVTRLTAEVEKLRAALEDCLSWHDYSNDMHKPIEVRAAYMRARAALSASQPAPAPVRTDSRFNNAERIFGDD